MSLFHIDLSTDVPSGRIRACSLTPGNPLKLYTITSPINDASVSWTIDDNIALTFDALNLTDETLHYFGDSPGQPRAFYDNGRQFFFGVRLKN